jgi:hypothetical protein
MVPIIMNAPGIMMEDKHNRYLSDEELDAVLPATGYAIVAPPPGYAPLIAPRKLMATPITDAGGFQIQDGSDAAAPPLLPLASLLNYLPKSPALVTLRFSSPKMRSTLPKFSRRRTRRSYRSRR